MIAWIVYHIFSSLSRTFFKFFFQNSHMKFYRLSSSEALRLEATLIEYHIHQALSRTFLNSFKLFRYSLSFRLSSSRSSQTALTEYQILTEMSTPFFIFFQILLQMPEKRLIYYI